jgi:hypothetical protein
LCASGSLALLLQNQVESSTGMHYRQVTTFLLKRIYIPSIIHNLASFGSYILIMALFASSLAKGNRKQEVVESAIIKKELQI